MLTPDISLQLGYCFDISLLSMVSVADFGLNTLDFDISLLSLVSNAKTDESELVLCSCMISGKHLNGPEYKEYYSRIL